MVHNRIAARATVVLAIIALALVGYYPAVAAPVQQEVVPGIYTSEPVVWSNGVEVDFTVILSSSGNAGFVTGATDGSGSFNEYGSWELTEDGLLNVTLTSDDESEYEEPYVILFEVDGDTLTAVEFDADYFGTEELSMTLELTEEEMAAMEGEAAAMPVGGMYASHALVAGDGSVGMALLHLWDDGTAQGNINYFDGASLPDVQTGEWAENDDGTVTLRLVEMLQVGEDGVEAVEMEEPIERVYEVGADGELIGENLTLYPVTSLALETAEPKAGSFSSEVLESARTAGLVITFTFYGDGAFESASDYMNKKPPFMEYGTWEEVAYATIAVTVTGDEDGEWDEPLTFTVEMQDDGSILAVDEEIFGEEGLFLYPNEE